MTPRLTVARIAPVEESPRLLTPDEAAARLRIRPRTLTAWARDGRIAFVDLSPRGNGRAGCVRFRETDIEAFIEAAFRKAGR